MREEATLVYQPSNKARHATVFLLAESVARMKALGSVKITAARRVTR